MKLEDAPPSGWYPDPERRYRLRWWEGTDWTDDSRALPSAAETDRALVSSTEPPRPAGSIPHPTGVRMRASDTDELVAEIREAARDEASRAADLLPRQARTAMQQARSVVADYANVVIRWIRIAVVVAATLVVAWFVLQFIAQATFLSWIGDRIDSITSS